MVNTMQPEALAIVILFPSVSTVIVAMRTYLRSAARQFSWGTATHLFVLATLPQLSANLPADDGLILVAWALAIAYAGDVYKWILVNGFGYHVWDLHPPTMEQNVLSMKLNMAQQLLYNPILCLVKASIIIFLLRLDDQRRVIKWSLYGLFFFNLGHMCGTFFGALTQCLPIPMCWNHYYTDITLDDGTVINPRYSCFDEERFSLITAGFAVLTDVLILCVPIVMVWNLHLGLRKKIAVAVVLSLGWIVAAVSILRFKIFYDYWEGTNKDPTYGLSQTDSGIEVNVAIWTACGPAMKAFITRFAPKFFGTSRVGTRATDGGYYHGGYNLSERITTSKNQRAQERATGSSRERDGDADSQERIIFKESPAANCGGVIGVEREIQQSYSPAAGSISWSSSEWNASHRTTVTGTYR